MSYELRTPLTSIGGSPLLRRMDKEHARVLALRSLRRFARPAKGNLPLLVAYEENATLRDLSAASSLRGQPARERERDADESGEQQACTSHDYDFPAGLLSPL